MISSAYETVATKKRLASYSGDKSSYASVAGDITGYFEPLDPNTNPGAAHIGGQAYRFTAEGTNDIKEHDILTISSVDYQVKGVRRYTMGSIDVIDCLLSKANKA